MLEDLSQRLPERGHGYDKRDSWVGIGIFQLPGQLEDLVRFFAKVPEIEVVQIRMQQFEEVYGHDGFSGARSALHDHVACFFIDQRLHDHDDAVCLFGCKGLVRGVFEEIRVVDAFNGIPG